MGCLVAGFRKGEADGDRRVLPGTGGEGPQGGQLDLLERLRGGVVVELRAVVRGVEQTVDRALVPGCDLFAKRLRPPGFIKNQHGR